MARKPISKGRRRDVRELLAVIDDPNSIWRESHTNLLCTIVEKTVPDEARQQIDQALSAKYLEKRRQLALDRKAIFTDELENALPKMAKQLEALTDFGFHKATVTDEDGNQSLDLSLLSAGDAKVAMQAMTLMLKSLGLLTTKLAVEKDDGSVFDAD